MVNIKSTCFIILMVMFFASVEISSEYNSMDREGVFVSKLLNPVTGEVNRDVVDILLLNCQLELKEASKVLGSSIPEEASVGACEFDSHGWSVAKAIIQKLLQVHHRSRQTILECIRKNNLVFDILGEESGFSIWDKKYLRYLHSRSSTRRHLLQSISLPPSNSALSPFSSPTTAPEIAPSPSDRVQSPASPGNSFFPRVINTDSPPPPSENSAAGPIPGSSTVNIKNNGNNHKTIVIAVVVTAAVTFVVAALFFICCSRIYGWGSGARRNDERPLLSLSLSDYSIGSSPNSYGFTNSIKEEKIGHNQSLRNYAISNKTNSFVEGSVKRVDETSSLGAADGTAKSSAEVPAVVPPPPGRLATDLPLKPPPGRAQPLPPEPPASLRPPSRAGPPLLPPTGSAQPLPPEPPASLRPPNRAGPPSPPPPPSGSAAVSPSAAPHHSVAPPPPPMAPGIRARPHPPPPPPVGGVGPPRPPPPLGPKGPRSLAGPKLSLDTAYGKVDGDGNAAKAKLKPFFWDKVMANPDHSMVWHQIKSGSFQFNEEMIESLFGYASVDKTKNNLKEFSSQDPSPQYIQILDTKRAQNLLILLRAQNVTIEEICDALLEGNELPAELLQTLLKMAPTSAEELKLRLFSGEISQLGPAERFLKALVDIPFAYKRMDALLFMSTLQEDVTSTKESFETLELACKELRNSRLFLKLLEAVLKTGNRMNDGTYRGGAQAFKLDTLLKLSDVKGTDGKTTLLHFVVQEIIRSEGVRASRSARDSQSSSSASVKMEDLEEVVPDTEQHYRNLGIQVVSHLSSELENVRRAAIIDADSLTGTTEKLGRSILKTRDFLNKEMSNVEGDKGFLQTLKSFVQNAEVDIMTLLEEEKRIMALVKSTGDYFHGNSAKDEGLHLFVIVRDFLTILDNVCREVREAQKRARKTVKKDTSSASTVPETRHQQHSPDLRQRLFPAIAERRVHSGSSSSSESDDES